MMAATNMAASIASPRAAIAHALEPSLFLAANGRACEPPQIALSRADAMIAEREKAGAMRVDADAADSPIHDGMRIEPPKEGGPLPSAAVLLRAAMHARCVVGKRILLPDKVARIFAADVILSRWDALFQEYRAGGGTTTKPPFDAAWSVHMATGFLAPPISAEAVFVLVCLVGVSEECVQLVASYPHATAVALASSLVRASERWRHWRMQQPEKIPDLVDGDLDALDNCALFCKSLEMILSSSPSPKARAASTEMHAAPDTPTDRIAALVGPLLLPLSMADSFHVDGCERERVDSVDAWISRAATCARRASMSPWEKHATASVLRMIDYHPRDDSDRDGVDRGHLPPSIKALLLGVLHAEAGCVAAIATPNKRQTRMTTSGDAGLFMQTCRAAVAGCGGWLPGDAPFGSECGGKGSFGASVAGRAPIYPPAAARESLLSLLADANETFRCQESLPFFLYANRSRWHASSDVGIGFVRVIVWARQQWIACQEHQQQQQQQQQQPCPQNDGALKSLSVTHSQLTSLFNACAHALLDAYMRMHTGCQALVASRAYEALAGTGADPTTESLFTWPPLAGTTSAAMPASVSSLPSTTATYTSSFATEGIGSVPKFDVSTAVGERMTTAFVRVVVTRGIGDPDGVTLCDSSIAAFAGLVLLSPWAALQRAVHEAVSNKGHAPVVEALLRSSPHVTFFGVPGVNSTALSLAGDSKGKKRVADVDHARVDTKRRKVGTDLAASVGEVSVDSGTPNREEESRGPLVCLAIAMRCFSHFGGNNEASALDFDGDGVVALVEHLFSGRSLRTSRSSDKSCLRLNLEVENGSSSPYMAELTRGVKDVDFCRRLDNRIGTAALVDPSDLQVHVINPVLSATVAFTTSAHPPSATDVDSDCGDATDEWTSSISLALRFSLLALRTVRARLHTVHAHGAAGAADVETTDRHRCPLEACDSFLRNLPETMQLLLQLTFTQIASMNDGPGMPRISINGRLADMLSECTHASVDVFAAASLHTVSCRCRPSLKGDFQDDWRTNFAWYERTAVQLNASARSMHWSLALPLVPFLQAVEYGRGRAHATRTSASNLRVALPRPLAVLCGVVGGDGDDLVDAAESAMGHDESLFSAQFYACDDDEVCGPHRESEVGGASPVVRLLATWMTSVSMAPDAVAHALSRTLSIPSAAGHRFFASFLAALCLSSIQSTSAGLRRILEFALPAVEAKTARAMRLWLMRVLNADTTSIESQDKTALVDEGRQALVSLVSRMGMCCMLVVAVARYAVDGCVEGQRGVMHAAFSPSAIVRVVCVHAKGLMTSLFCDPHQRTRSSRTLVVQCVSSVVGAMNGLKNVEEKCKQSAADNAEEGKTYAHILRLSDDLKAAGEAVFVLALDIAGSISGKAESKSASNGVETVASIESVDGVNIASTDFIAPLSDVLRKVASSEHREALLATLTRESTV